MELHAETASVGEARRFAGDRLDRRGLSEVQDVAVLLTSELVTNAVVHGGGGASVVVGVADGSTEVGVIDHRTLGYDLVPLTGTDRVAPTSDGLDLAGGGRGLVIVGALAHERGAALLPGGKQVWSRLDVAHWSYRSACPCHRGHLDRVRLGSGGFALPVTVSRCASVPRSWVGSRS